MDKKRKQNASGGGLYAAIALCLLAVGVGSWQIFHRAAIRTADHANAVSGSAAVSDSRPRDQTARGDYAPADQAAMADQTDTRDQAAMADQDGMADHTAANPAEIANQERMAKAPDLEAGAVPTPSQAAAPAQSKPDTASNTGGNVSAPASTKNGGAAAVLSAKEGETAAVSGNAVIPADTPAANAAQASGDPNVNASDDPGASGVRTGVSMTPPLEGEAVTAFSMARLIYNETLRDWRTHDGLDITADEGAGVCAALDGTVASVTADPLMGTTVVIRHEGERETLYACLNANVEIEAGDDVSAGQLIGFVGQGKGAEAALGPHLHFSVLENGEAVDPSAYLP